MTEPSVEILLVQRDQPQIQLTLDVVRSNRLAERILVVRDGAEALEFLFRSGSYSDRQGGDPRLILYHLGLGSRADLDTLTRIVRDPRTAAIPVTVLACSAQERLAAITELRKRALQMPVVVIARPVPEETVHALASIAGTGPDATGDEAAVTAGRADDSRLTAEIRRAAAEALLTRVCLERDLDALLRLAQGAAHEFNNLFSVFMSYTELLLKDLDPDDSRRAGAEEIFRSIARASRLTRQILAFTPTSAPAELPAPDRSEPAAGKCVRPGA